MKNILLTLLLMIPTLSWADSYIVAIEGMHCPPCAEAISQKLTSTFKKEKIQNVKVSFPDNKATFEAKSISEKEIKKTIKDLGFTVKSVEVTKN